QRHARHRVQPSFPTRRSSDLKNGDEPEILIVVDKLLTGFDAPRNTVLYLARRLKDHSLLQAIARVNRLYEDESGSKAKDFGYIIDRKSTRLNSSHVKISYAVF